MARRMNRRRATFHATIDCARPLRPHQHKTKIATTICGARLPNLVTLLALALAPLLLPAPAWAGDHLVFAAASLKEALEEVVEDWTRETGTRAEISFAGSSVLARQIEAGAPAELFLSANTAWMDQLDRGGLLEPGGRIDLLSNRLVLISSTIAQPTDLEGAIARIPGEAPIAMALVDAVPAGIYGKAALRKLDAWDSLAPQVVQTDNVRAALALVATGAAPFGIVYATDAQAEPRVHVIAEFPADSHPPINYPLALIEGAGESARDLWHHLASPSATAIFLDHGFNQPATGE
ncbi:molybdate transport system substrate-binding protein [Aliiruegeria haliotis]|uniref:Molybdate transport system substrate-binding protein n=1 Tax=Aliiruegeria haliotis TaxID=1280846 RepID=A0A2T0RFH9_9RHOB|nr:molybdate ABC transporter substrate-binding protein [Aliiruegeria haliotis]PRY19860.1 molybdate transport system substrate-binding protein [Aliiruegeria haliotis]